MAWLVRSEAFPEFFTMSIDGYRGILSSDVLLTETWMKILYRNSPIGFSHTSVEMADSNRNENYSIKNRMQLKMTIMGEVNNIHVDSATTLNSMHELQKFTFAIFSRDYRLNLKGHRIDEKRFAVTMNTGMSSEKRNVEIPKDAVIYSPTTDIAIRKLRPGQQLRLKTVDPATMTTANIIVRAVGTEDVTIGTNRYTATVIAMDYRGTELRSWIDKDGNMLRQQTPFGWTMEKCTASDALEIIKSATAPSDMLAGMSVKSSGLIREPRTAAALRLQLNGVQFGESELATHRQKITLLEGNRLEMEICRATFPAAYALPSSLPDEIREQQKPSQGVQSDHPDIRARAAEITAGLQNDSERAKAIFEWVHRKVVKQPAVTLPSALDVLRTMKGDCNEHTYLYVALARASGIPARITVGLAFHEGAFYYHAWPSVWLGNWVETDPTWGQLAVDTTHIALYHGDLQEQLNLVKVMGQLSIKILEEKKE